MGCSVIHRNTEWHAGSGLHRHPTTFLCALTKLPSVGQVGWQQPSPASLQVCSTVALIRPAQDPAGVRMETLLTGLWACSLTWLEGNGDCLCKVLAELYSHRSFKSRQCQSSVRGYWLLFINRSAEIIAPLPFFCCTSRCSARGATHRPNVTVGLFSL